MYCGKALKIKPEALARVIQNQPTETTDSLAAPISLIDDSLIVRKPEVGKSHGAGLIVALLLLLAAGAGLFFLRSPGLLPPATDASEEASKSVVIRESEPKLDSGQFPRRALAICVNNYLYANPVSYGEDGHNLHDLMERLIRFLHVPTSQFAELSDASPHSLARDLPSGVKKKAASTVRKPLQSPPTPPLKTVVLKSVEAFLATSRPQDRILLLWIGHLVEIDGAAYLAPIEGELDRKETLLPLTWLYDHLEECKAREKILVLDCCRLDPTRGQERPGSGPLGAKAAEMLAKPPTGVQVLSACAAGQFSYEQEENSVFLVKFFDALTQKTLSKKLQEPGDPLPIHEIAESVIKNTTEAVRESWQATQTPMLSGAPTQSEALAATEEPPSKVTIASPQAAEGGTAKQRDVSAIFSEIAIPAVRRAREQTAPLQIESLIPFSEKALEPYLADTISTRTIEDHPEKYPLRAVVLETVKLLRRSFAPSNDVFSIQEIYAGGNRDKLKADIQGKQTKPALLYEELNEALTNLERAGEDRKADPSPRWQAHFQYVHAQLLARAAFAFEYDFMLANIRTDRLPMPEGYAPSGWRLSSQEKMQSGKEMREKVKKAGNILEKLIKEHPGTPWEILAKRDLKQALGLKWEPYR
jgi:hypothetical protein